MHVVFEAIAFVLIDWIDWAIGKPLSAAGMFWIGLAWRSRPFFSC